MKKSIAIVLCLVIVFSCLSLTACGGKKDLSDSKYVGTWKATYLSLKDETGELEEDTYLILNPDGTAEFVSDDEVSTCNWQETKNGFKLTGDTKLKFTDDGDGIVTTILGVGLHFERQ